MLLSNIPVKEGSTSFVQGLLSNKDLKTYGVSYTNSFFSQRYLCRQHLLSKAEFTEDSIKLTVATRVEQVGLMELENTLDFLVQYEAGDIPGLTPEGLLEPEEDHPVGFLPEAVSVAQFLTSVDLLLVMKDPEVTYQIFDINGCKFTLVNIHHKLGEDFEQTVTLLLGKPGKLYFLSHLHGNPELDDKDVEILLELVVDENITGKAIRGVSMNVPGAQSSIFPFDRLISSYTASNGDYVFGDGSGYVTIERDALSQYYVSCEASEKGAYTIQFYCPDSDQTIEIHFE
jgi:hypothetical protein